MAGFYEIELIRISKELTNIANIVVPPIVDYIDNQHGLSTDEDKVNSYSTLIEIIEPNQKYAYDSLEEFRTIKNEW